ncbi:hypothetical protein H8959_005596 [Pygathrix nigripes]
MTSSPTSGKTPPPLTRTFDPKQLAGFPGLLGPRIPCIPVRSRELEPPPSEVASVRPLAAATVTRQSNPKTSAHNALGGPGKTARGGDRGREGREACGRGEGYSAAVKTRRRRTATRKKKDVRSASLAPVAELGRARAAAAGRPLPLAAEEGTSRPSLGGRDLPLVGLCGVGTDPRRRESRCSRKRVRPRTPRNRGARRALSE